MKINDIMISEKAYLTTDCDIPSGVDVYDLQLEDIVTAEEYIGVTGDDGKKIGVFKTEYLRYLIRNNKSSRFIKIMDLLDVGVCAIDVNTRIFYVNEAYSKLLDVKAGKILGRRMDVIEPGAKLLNILKTGVAAASEDLYVKTLDKHVSGRLMPIRENGTIIGAVSIFTDRSLENRLSDEINHIQHIANEYREQANMNDYLSNGKIIGDSAAFSSCIKRAVAVAKTDATVFIRGENGTGKEVFANLIQANSDRSEKPFIKVNCAAIPDSLIESELFGYEEGAFTGAKKGGSAGKIELADGGTLLMDEIGDVSLPMQAKLLRFLQEGEIERIGSRHSKKVDVRVIAATNKPLEDMINEGKFRMDLYYRLNVVSIMVPPLRERGNDVVLLADTFLSEFNARYNFAKKFCSESYAAMLNYDWPGNVRELRNAVECAVVLSEHTMIHSTDFPESISGRNERTNEPLTESVSGSETSGFVDYEELPQLSGTLKDVMGRIEKSLLIRALNQYGGDKDLVMEQLGLSRRTFYRKLAAYDIKY